MTAFNSLEGHFEMYQQITTLIRRTRQNKVINDRGDFPRNPIVLLNLQDRFSTDISQEIA